ncbi:DUF6498-containing protein [Aquisalinus flavus]|uniref:Uncharacterized protein n=1 Tax=Aquisalinus flavus TaxID=1526572 RepID=A0A8J2V1Q2_9PROT|nr:DUF6498-containing protein [Aquisalinus flavus]MBD0427676.1 hypothetical protein [Aquisalinus flavus]UNE47458.1 hypothetical protein FF099_04980 [Aquisalinus flavus]GGD02939.1 hypothetical protein GCM10011342_09910 [Aquisalinus flavus]
MHLHHVRNAGLFALTVLIAWLQDWRAADIAWSMWISSLVTGYAWIVVTILTSGHQIMYSDGFGGKIPVSVETRPPASAMIALGLFLLAFFTVHFGGFHFGHAQFLKMFFPVEGIDADTGFKTIILTTLALYWPFVTVTMAERSMALINAAREGRTFNLFAPYLAVVKNHLMIILIGFTSLLIKQELVLWLLLAFYFFPYEDVFKGKESPFTDTVPGNSEQDGKAV